MSTRTHQMHPPPLRRFLLLSLVLALAACHLTLETTNSNSNTGGTGGSGPTSPTPPTPAPAPTPNPTPVPTPTPIPGGGGRTADPPPGFVLPLPSYAPTVIASIPFDASATCLSFGYLDAVVDALRARDTRWGYSCSSSGCGAVSLDKLAYHATPGPEITGAIGNWIVDIIVDVCGAARPGFSANYEALTGWASRGRF